MAENRGKQFEQCIKNAFEKIDDVSVDRLYDPMAGYSGIKNICDFIVYRKPNEYYIECKSVHGNTFPFSNITDTQYYGLIEKSKIHGVFAGIMCWWIDRDVTMYLPIALIKALVESGYKSIRYDLDDMSMVNIPGTKRRVLFDYDMTEFFNEVNDNE